MRCTIDANSKILPPKEVKFKETILSRGLEVVREALEKSNFELDKYKRVNEGLNVNNKKKEDFMRNKYAKIHRLYINITEKDKKMSDLEV